MARARSSGSWPYRIRQAAPGDLETLCDVERAAGRCFRDVGMPEIADDEPLPAEILGEYQRAGRAWVAVDGTDHVVAYLIHDLVDGSVHIEQVSVHPDHARRGIGRSLIDRTAEQAAAAGATALTLTTFRDVPWNAPYYLRCGFRVVDEAAWTPGLRAIRHREADHGLDRRPRVCMRRDLPAPTGRVEEHYADPGLARLYDAECRWHPQDDFYLDLDLRAGSVLDVGCGTGTRLAHAREVGHRGTLVGADPAPGMLAVARGKSADVEWVRADAQTLDLRRRFELVTMTGHAFQVLLDDASVLAALYRFREHLAAGGLLAFETRNPEARAWERWTEARTRSRIEAPDGEPFEVWVDNARHDGTDQVTFTSTRLSLRTGIPRATPNALRFVDPELLRDHLIATGFRIEGWYGDWDRSPVVATSPEIIVLARPAS